MFFPDSEPGTATLLSLATFGVGYVARPIGAFFMGHLGDRHGRKRVLVLTMLLMGTATFLVGCLPTYDDIGILAPILLVALRLVQGFAASGEQAGANSFSLEHAPDRRRAFFTSFTLSGTQTGLVIATATWLPIGALPDDQLQSWGWRVPFWLSAIVVVAGLVIRRRLEEPPAFREAVERGDAQRPARRPAARPPRGRRPRDARLAGLDRQHDLRGVRARRSPSTPSASTRRRCCGSRS